MPQRAVSPSVDDFMALYVKEIGESPLLTAEEERTLAMAIEMGKEAKQRLADGDLDKDERWALEKACRAGQRARRRLIEANMRLVVSIARRYANFGLPLLDLIQEGNLGLMRAVEGYDYRLGNKFSTYATWWIRQSVMRAIADQGRTIRLPTRLHEGIIKLKQVSRSLTKNLGHEPTNEELAEAMATTTEHVERLKSLTQTPISLELTVDDDGHLLGDQLHDASVASTEDEAFGGLVHEEIEALLWGLSARESRVLELRFGLRDGNAYNLAEIGRKFDLTRERVRQIQEEALTKLRQTERVDRLADFIHT